MDAGVAILFIALSVVYFIPSILASGKKNNTGVILVNLFLGWTLIGWVGSLVWAVMLPRAPSDAELVAQSADNKKCPFCAELIKAEAIVCKHCGRDLQP